ncbi:peptidoglycan-binding domain-containing protein [Pseudoroseicyclus aestuarii]|uniref:Putative peptidoglycan binding protein n=1 Tax=Pseudoroseicyclus aestuarii TaxID=1795041 RepID=A0A318SV86_9RHOB|nr:peptidoglycan-binding domain-containing protein [Pseudoroseicyclus aestuarii]PYE84226.1 putative peptidoglycan binding protein [Pseudoroseicyclus aestuarii]
MRLPIAPIVALIVAAPAALAQEDGTDAALIFGNEYYEVLGRTPNGASVIPAQEGLRALGFEVTALPNGRADATADALRSWQADAAGAQRLVAVMAGRFMTDGERSWYLTAEAEEPRLLSPGAQAIDLAGVLRLLAEAPGESILLLGVAEGDERYDSWLRAGLGPLDIPQGVTVLTGSPQAAAAFAGGALSQPQVDLAPLIAQAQGLEASGYLPASRVFMPAEAAQDEAPEQPQADTEADETLWQGATALDTVEGYRDYLRRFPNGQQAEAAEEAIAAILAEPNRDARLAEEGLELSRDRQREIQRSLSLLDYDTRGIDGIFGSGTRQAITNWQQQNGFPQTSYLTPEQISRLEAQAARRSAELEARAEQQRREAEQLDRAYWDETGSAGDEPGLRAYLERYPDGLFAETAADRLSMIEEEKRQAAEAQDRAAWDRAREADAIAGYEDYLNSYQNGAFRAEAQSRIQALQQASSDEAQSAQATETALGLNPLTRRLVEARLDGLNLEPGGVDGVFDENTRRALRRFQTDRELEVTGYLNEQTVVRLLADAITGQ